MKEGAQAARALKLFKKAIWKQIIFPSFITLVFSKLMNDNLFWLTQVWNHFPIWMNVFFPQELRKWTLNDIVCHYHFGFLCFLNFYREVIPASHSVGDPDKSGYCQRHLHPWERDLDHNLKFVPSYAILLKFVLCSLSPHIAAIFLHWNLQSRQLSF